MVNCIIIKLNIEDGIHYFTNLDFINNSTKKLDLIRAEKLEQIKATLFSIDLAIPTSKVFWYTNENYSHINNKFDLDDHEQLKEIKLFSNYMHAKYLKSMQVFGVKDHKLIEELRNIEKIHALDIEFDEDVYLYIFTIL